MKEAQQDQILEVASKLFIEKGFPGTSMQDIADGLGMTRTAVYYYFKNKEQILEALVAEVTVRARRQSSSVAAQLELKPPQRLEALVFAHANLILTHRDQFRVVERSESQLPTAVRRSHEESKRQVLGHFTEVIDEGVRSGHFRVVDARIAAFGLIGMCNWTAFWYRTDGRLAIDDVARMIAKQAVQSVVRPAGRVMNDGSVEESLQVLEEDVAHLRLLLTRKDVS